MSVNGLGGAVNTIRMPQTTPTGRVEQNPLAQPQSPPIRPAAIPPKAPPQRAAPTTQTERSVPVEAPPGTDPELWSVLSTEERKFFARVGAMGPLTYGYLMKNGMEEAPVGRGGRLDVRA